MIDLGVKSCDRVSGIAGFGLAAKYDGIIEPITKPPQSITIEIVNSKGVLGIGRKSVKETPWKIDTSYVQLKIVSVKSVQNSISTCRK